MPLPSAHEARPVSRRTRRALGVAVAAVLAVLVAAIVWAFVRPGADSGSRAGCVSVTVPSSTGGALLHECGAAARGMCRGAFAHTDRLSLAERPQCRLAGLAP